MSIEVENVKTGKSRSVVSAGSLIGDHVRNSQGETLGTIEQIMLDVTTGRMTYVVLSHGGFLGLADKLFAVPWEALRFDEKHDRFFLDVDKKVLDNAPGFDKSSWPDMADPVFGTKIREHFAQVYEETVTDAGDYVGDNTQHNRSVEFEPVEGYRQKPSL